MPGIGIKIVTLFMERSEKFECSVIMRSNLFLIESLSWMERESGNGGELESRESLYLSNVN